MPIGHKFPSLLQIYTLVLQRGLPIVILEETVICFVVVQAVASVGPYPLK